MKLLLAFAFAALSSGFLAGDTLGGENGTIAVFDIDADCNVEERKEVIPGMV